MTDPADIDTLIAQAVQAERERCEQIARDYSAGFEKALYLYGAADVDAGRGRQEGHINASRELADLILSGAHPHPPISKDAP